ncbi:MAG TPA: two-component regulator propeller domain-containing protein [Flavobacteriales bacterium]|nr:two-component regulator propeller domain-containing protein [Flavobacteriales bacterium]
MPLHGRFPVLRAMWCGLLLLGALVASAQDPIFRRFTLQNGLPSNTLYYLMQDRDGFMWFGTDHGACRYDGRTFRTFTTDDGLADNEVLEIHQDSQGRIWFLSVNGRLSYMVDGRIHNEWNTPFLRQCKMPWAMYSFVEDKQGNIWIGAIPSDLLVIRPDGTTLRPLSKSLPAEEEVIAVALEGDSVQVTIGPRTYRPDLTGRPWRLLYNSGTKNVVRVVNDARQRGWVRTAEGIAALDAQGRPTPPIDLTGSTPLAWNLGMRVFRTSSGALWISCVRNGVVHCVPQGEGYGPPRIYFPNERVTCAMEDAAGNVWLATQRNGIVLVPREQVGSVYVRGYAGGAQEEFHTVLMARDGSVWTGSDLGVVYHVVNGRVDTVNVRIELGLRERVNGFAQSSDGTIWYVSDASVGRITVQADGRLVNRPVYASGRKVITIGTDDRLYLGMFGVGSLKVGSPGSEVRWTPMAGRVYCLQLDRKGALWYEMVDTLYRVEDGASTRYTDWAGRRFGRIKELDLLGADTIVVMTESGGVGLFRDGQVLAQYDHAHGLASDHCQAVCVHKGEIYVVTALGLSVIDPRTGRITNTDLMDGLAMVPVHKMVMDDRWFYLATAQGLVQVPRTRTAPIGPAPPLRFTSIQVNGEDRLVQAPLLLRHGVDRLVMEATLLSFSVTGTPEYQYRTAADGPWTSSRTGRLEFAALEPGEYDLQVRGRMPGQPWSTSLGLPMHVSPPFWRSTFARTLLALLAFVIAFLALRWWANRRLRMRTALLHQQEILSRERQRIAMDVHDDLGADLSNLLLLSRLAVQEQQGGSSTLLRMEGLASSMMLRIDEIIWSLDPRQDTVGATVAFLDRYASDFARSHNLLFRSHVMDTEDASPVPAPFRRGLYLILKEALNNVAKHARARHLRFQAGLSEGHLRLLVEDDGVGLGAAGGSRTGNGLANMQRRATHMGGSVEVVDRGTQGTVVHIAIPIAAARPKR